MLKTIFFLAILCVGLLAYNGLSTPAPQPRQPLKFDHIEVKSLTVKSGDGRHTMTIFSESGGVSLVLKDREANRTTHLTSSTDRAGHVLYLGGAGGSIKGSVEISTDDGEGSIHFVNPSLDLSWVDHDGFHKILLEN